MILDQTYIKIHKKVSLFFTDPHLARIVTLCYMMKKGKSFQGIETRTYAQELNIYHHIINSCVNRQRVLNNPHAKLVEHSMEPEIFKLKVISELKRKKDYESKELYQFCIKGYNRLSDNDYRHLFGAPDVPTQQGDGAGDEPRV